MRSLQPCAFIGCIILILIAVPTVATAAIAPSITIVPAIQMSPSEGYRGSDFSCDITGGSGFVAGDQITLEGGGTTITATGETIIGSTLQCHLVVPSDANIGAYTLRITHSRGGVDTVKANAFTVYPAPSVTGISPTKGSAGETFPLVSVSGTGIRAGAQVYLLEMGNPSNTIEATGETIIDATHIQCTLALPLSAKPGSYVVEINYPTAWTNSVQTSTTFTVDPVPTVTGINPTSIPAGQTRTGVEITGTGLRAGGQVTLLSSTGATRIEATDEVCVNPNKIVCTLPVPWDADIGQYDLIVSNPYMGASMMKDDAFNVVAETVTITRTDPTSAGLGETVPVSVYGTGFAKEATVAFVGNSMAVLHATDVTVVNANQIQCTLAIPQNGVAGPYTVAVTNPGNPIKYGASGGFTVYPLPTITSINPDSSFANQAQTVHVYGTGFKNGAEVEVGVMGGILIPATGESFINSGHIQCTLAIPSGAPADSYYVAVKNPSMVYGVYKYGAFTVLPPPTVTGMSPTSATPGSTLTTVDIYGTGFTSTSIPEVSMTGGPSPGGTFISATNVNVLDSGHIRCSMTIPGNAYLGKYAVYVHYGTIYGSKADAFTVTSAPPTVTSIAPSSGGQGTTVSVTNLSGYRFQAGATVKLTRTGSADIAATGVSVVSATKIICSIALPATAPMGTWNVVVANPDGQSGTLTNGFTVTPASVSLTVTSITPNSGTAGTTVAITDLAGTGFVSGATVKLTRTGSADIAATNVAFVSATKLTCSLAMPSTAAAGAWTVVVTNPGAQSATLTGGFTVNPATSGVKTLPGGIGPPQDLNLDGRHEDVNGNGRADFADVVLYFNQMTWIAANEPVTAFDYNGNGRIDFADVVWLFNNL